MRLSWKLLATAKSTQQFKVLTSLLTPKTVALNSSNIQSMKVKKPQTAVVKTAVSDRIRTLLGSMMVMVTVSGTPLAHAQAQVVESSNRLMTTPAAAPVSGPSTQSSPAQAFAAAPAQAQGQPPADSQYEVFEMLQTLQEEVATLRGLVEEQDYELKQLKQQRLDDYLNLDRRIGELSGKPGAGAAPTSASGNPAGVASGGSAPAARTAAPAGEQSADELQMYRSAIDLVLRQKNYDQAIIAFNQYLTDYPQGAYAANSEYWLGEISLLQGNLEKSRSWFERLLSDFPAHDKAADAQYKLGTVYHRLGNTQKAKSLLNEVVAKNPNTNAARLASNYLSGM